MFHDRLKLIYPVYKNGTLTDHVASLHMTCFGWVACCFVAVFVVVLLLFLLLFCCCFCCCFGLVGLDEKSSPEAVHQAFLAQP